MKMKDVRKAIATALPHVRVLTPSTVLPVQLYGTYGDERFAFYWKRHHAELVVGPPAEFQPHSAKEQEKFWRQRGRAIGLHDLAIEDATATSVDWKAAETWIEPEPRLVATMATDTEERKESIVEVYLELERRLAPPRASRG
ncbi:hypothetical protein EVU97_00600 [Dermacoccus sp. 147Ba]|uniref:hypothetical protein n=1 Tax=Dermacoccus sp. 147Ba TaxID=2510111 RepID=UPI00101D9A70|nr:hypothetical protein [Dermacoccus sp. 147Ba]RYI24257.1 hypothetical protein EVU97_00600 [Dermacoccus sp. 147Ba]